MDVTLAYAPAGHGSAAPSILHRRSNETRLLVLRALTTTECLHCEDACVPAAGSFLVCECDVCGRRQAEGPGQHGARQVRHVAGQLQGGQGPHHRRLLHQLWAVVGRRVQTGYGKTNEVRPVESPDPGAYAIHFRQRPAEDHERRLAVMELGQDPADEVVRTRMPHRSCTAGYPCSASDSVAAELASCGTMCLV